MFLCSEGIKFSETDFDRLNWLLGYMDWHQEFVRLTKELKNEA